MTHAQTGPGRRDVALLALCQALFLTATSAVIASAALIGHGLAETKSLATLPIGLQFLATMAATVPASLLMKQIGRRGGFTVGTFFGIAGAGVGYWSIMEGDFALFCVGSALIGGLSITGSPPRTQRAKPLRAVRFRWCSPAA
jgi:hypothetical protein